MDPRIERFAQLVHQHRAAEYCRQYPNGHPSVAVAYALVEIRPGRRWTRVDVGQSGKYMVDANGDIYGIKAYGVPHLGHPCGTLDTVDERNWGGYGPSRRAPLELAEARGPLPDHFPPRVEVLRLCPASGMTLREALELAAEDSEDSERKET